MTWITATPPTPNGELHVGHLAGPYVAADVLRRFLRADGDPALLTTGMDDHQSYVPVRGLKDGRTAEEVSDGYGRDIVAGWSAAGVEFDRIVQPRTDRGYPRVVQDFFLRLFDSGAIVPRTRDLPWCPFCERWLYEAYVAGGCPHCGLPSGGNACEACGRPNHCGDLVEPRCAVCQEPALLRPCERLFLPLAPFADRLAELWDRVAMPPHLRALCERMSAEGLPEIAVSHPGSWGVPVPVPGFEHHRIYVWLEMAPGYLLERDAEGGLPTEGPVQLFGFDNGYFHAVLFPAAYLALDPHAPLPAAFLVNEFYRLEGRKFSTSRRHAVWALEALREVGSDVLRYHVLSDRPNGRQTNFTREALQRSRRHLHEHWNGWLERLLTAVETDCAGRPPAEPPSGPAWERLAARLRRAAEDLRDAYSVAGFDPRRAVAILDEVVALAADFGHVQAHQRSRPAGAAPHRAALSGQLAIAGALTAWAAPVMPAGAERLARLLGRMPGGPVTAQALSGPALGTVLSAPAGPVFGA